MKKISILIFTLLFTVSASALTAPREKVKYNVTLTTKGGAVGYFTTIPFVGLAAGKTMRVEQGTVLKINAIPSNLAQVKSWGGDCANATGTVCTITIDGPKTVFATFGPIEKVLSKTERMNASSTCAITALNKRDNAIIASIQKYSSDWIATINTRNTSQKSAYEKTGTERISGLKSASNASSKSQSEISKALTNSKNKANSIYRAELRACGYANDDRTEE